MGIKDDRIRTMTTWRPLRTPVLVPDFGPNTIVAAPKFVAQQNRIGIVARIRGKDKSFAENNTQKNTIPTGRILKKAFLTAVALAFFASAFHNRSLIRLEMANANEHIPTTSDLHQSLRTYSFHSFQTAIEGVMMRMTHLG